MTTIFELNDRDNAVAQAILTVLNEQDGIDAFEADEVPSPRPPEYVQTFLTRRYGGRRNVGGRLSVVGYRLTVTAVSEAYIANVRHALSICAATLEFRRVEVDGFTTTPIQFESQRTPAPDAGRFSGATNYTFAIN